MTTTDCAELHARSNELHELATASVETALLRGPDWAGFTEEVAGAARLERLADALEARIAEDC